MPTEATLHIDSALTDFSIAYINDTFIGDIVSPPLPVDKQSDKYFVYQRDAFLRTSRTDVNGRSSNARRPGTAANVIDYAVSALPFYAEQYAIRQLVTDAEMQIADQPLQPMLDATMVVTERLKLDNETNVAGMVGNISSYNTANEVTLTGGATGTSWAQYGSANSLPFTNISNGRVAVQKGLLRPANTLVVNLEAAMALADHPSYKDLYKFTDPSGLTLSGLVPNIRGLNVLEGSAQFINGNLGSANQTSSDIWVASDGSNMAAVMYVSPDTQPKSVQSFRTFEAPDPTSHVRGYTVYTYRWEELEGSYVEGHITRDYRPIGVDSNGKIIGAYLIAGVTN